MRLRPAIRTTAVMIFMTAVVVIDRTEGAPTQGTSTALSNASRPSQDTLSRMPRRPFDHARHQQVSCSSCHGTGAQHRSLLVNTARDCAACHHDARRTQSCTTCHGADRLPAPRALPAKMALSVWDSVGSRSLPFRHDVHLRAGTGCTECHRTPVTLAMNRDCASCHTPHHRPEATCSSCHTAPKTGVHNAKVHLSCSGSGCHASAVAPLPTQSRTTCLTCHQAQKNHEPQGSCASCHRIPTRRAG
jgi:hypothetical protein